ncbi:MAG: metal-dependent hydrolase [Deltaproteobacteria bacterium]|nr:metal-dependent hydrolase [Deltaproteobacteria bacterium]
MSNRRTHRTVGAAVGAASALVMLEKNATPLESVAEIFGGGLGGILGSALPDIVEPATSPNHRDIFHSAAAAAGLVRQARRRVSTYQRALCTKADAYAVKRKQPDASFLDQLIAFIAEIGLRVAAGFVSALAPGYLSHLALDASTPKSIPLLAARVF